MIKEATATGRTLDEAIDTACLRLGLAREDVEVEVLERPRKGFLGLSYIPAKVTIRAELPDPPAPPASRSFPDHGGKAQAAAGYIQSVLRAMGLQNVSVRHTQEENNVLLSIEGDAGGVSIGRRGETLDALQYLAGLTVNRMEGEYVRIVLDSGNYRDKRRHTLEQLARKLANTAIKTGRSTTLDPMNPYERRVIHSTISTIEGVTSTSVGEEPNRCVVISSTSPRPPREDGGQDRRPGGGGPRPQEDRGPRPQGDRGPRPGGDRGGRFGRGPDRRGPRREKPEPYKESSLRETPPSEAADKPLYGKVEL